MSLTLYPDSTYAELAYGKKLSQRQIAAMLGVGKSTVGDALKRWRQEHGTAAAAIVHPSDYLLDENDPAFQFEIEDPIRLILDDLIVSADWHVPLFSVEWFNRLISDAAERQIKTLVIVGDYLNGDWLSDFLPKQNDAGLDREMETATLLLEKLALVFDDIILLKGNHDIRMLKQLGYKTSFARSMKMLLSDLSESAKKKITYSNLDHVLIHCPSTGQDWRFAHTHTYSQKPLVVAGDVALVEKENIGVGHSHHCAIGRARDGRILIDLGGLFDREKTSYLKDWTTKYPHWANGYVRFEGGKPTLVGDGYDAQF